MKVSKKVLSMVLCGLIVAGSGQATLVNANAQTRTISISSNISSTWEDNIKIGVQEKAFPSIKKYIDMRLVFRNGYLKLELPKSVSSSLTFTDTFLFGWQKKGEDIKAPIEFRTCNGASAQKTLENVVRIFNNANLTVGDKFFMTGQRWETSITFPDDEIVGVTGNDYSKGYQPEHINRNNAAFYINSYGLSESMIPHGNLY